jgi:hypothetical protein
VSVWDDRVADASAETSELSQQLHDAAIINGYDDNKAIWEAISWAAVQLDPEADDYETWEATVFARLDNPDAGER